MTRAARSRFAGDTERGAWLRRPWHVCVKRASSRSGTKTRIGAQILCVLYVYGRLHRVATLSGWYTRRVGGRSRRRIYFIVRVWVDHPLSCACESIRYRLHSLLGLC